MPLPRHPEVAEWLSQLDDETRAEVDEAIAYLAQQGRAAALPDVRHRIQTSRHFPDMSEIRVDLDRSHLYRVLVGFGSDQVPALLLAGNKAGIEDTWYTANVPVADARFDTYLTALKKSKEET
jgi:hypothetical protein